MEPLNRHECELLDTVQTPDCGVLSALDRDWTAQRYAQDLTHHGGDGLWMCPTHWAEFYTYEPPRLTTYGAIMTGAKG